MIFDEFSREDASEKPLVLHEVVAKRVFQALTEVDQDGRLVRRPMKFGELEKYVSSSDWNDEEASAAVLSVVTRLAAPDCSFLRIMKIDDLDDNSIVDIGHEALVRRWSKLKGGGETDWIREEQDDGEKYRDLVRIARAHSTIPDAELLAYEAWWARRKPTATWAKRYSKAGKDSFAQVGEALARSRQECEEGERERAAAARAEIEAREARLRLATAEAQMEAARARASVAEERAKVSAAEVAVHLQKVRMTRIAAADPGQRAGFGVWSGDGKDIVTSTFFEGQPSVWNAFSGKIDADLENVVAAGLKPDRLLSSLAMSASGKFIAEGDSKGAITVLRTDSGEVEAPLDSKQDGLTLMQMYFDPVDDNQLLAIYQSIAVLWNVASGKQQPLEHNHATIMQAAFDPRGQFIVTAANDGTVRLFKLSQGVAMQGVELRGHHGPVFAVDVAPDGTIVSGSGDGSVRFWQAEPVGSPSRHDSFEAEEVEKLKSFVDQNLPYLDYGSDRITLPDQILCSLTDACEKTLSQAAQ